MVDAIPTKLCEPVRLVSNGVERTQEQADPNLPADSGPHLLAYREQITPDDQAWPMQLFPKPEQPLRFIAYACDPLPSQDIYRLGLDPNDELLERVIVAITPAAHPNRPPDRDRRLGARSRMFTVSAIEALRADTSPVTNSGGRCWPFRRRWAAGRLPLGHCDGKIMNDDFVRMPS